MNVAVGIYKIPPKWDRLILDKFIKYPKISYENSNNISEFKEHKNRITNIENNVYFELFKQIITVHSCKKAHYIFIDESIENNYKCLINNINVWILKTHEDLCYFMDANLYFFRGNYLNYYYNYTKNNNDVKIIFYPATSLIFSYYKNNILIKNNTSFKRREIVKKCNNTIDHPFYNKIDIAFVHEDNEYQNIYKNSKKIILFNKPAANTFNYKNLNREYDFIFIGDATQFTKNHHLVFHFIDYCETNKIAMKIIYISDHNILKQNIYNYIHPNNLHYVSLYFDNYLTPDIMNNYMNKSTINLTFSGRDAFPRTITETLSAGCYNIALDTLSDGKSAITNIFGEVIGNPNGKFKILKSKSISYETDSYLWKQIIDRSKRNFNHEKISLESKEKYNYKNILLLF